MRSWADLVANDCASFGPVGEEAAIMWTCAVAIWCWDRGYRGDYDDIISTALRERWECPPAFHDINDDIREGRRPVSKKSIAKLKTSPGALLLAARRLMDARHDEQEALRERPRPVLLRPDPEPHAARRASEARLDSVAKSLADDLGISVAVLKRTERELRQHVADFLKK